MDIYKGGKLTEVSKNKSSWYGNAEAIGVIYCGGIFNSSSRYTSQFVKTGELDTYDGTSKSTYIPLSSDLYGNDPNHVFWRLEQIIIEHIPNVTLYRFLKSGYGVNRNSIYTALSGLDFKQILVTNSSKYTMNVRLVAQMSEAGSESLYRAKQVTLSRVKLYGLDDEDVVLQKTRCSADLITGSYMIREFSKKKLRNFLIGNLENRALRLKIVADVIDYPSHFSPDSFRTVARQFSVTSSYNKETTLFSPKLHDFGIEKTNVVVEGEISSDAVFSNGINQIRRENNEIVINTKPFVNVRVLVVKLSGEDLSDDENSDMRGVLVHETNEKSYVQYDEFSGNEVELKEQHRHLIPSTSGLAVVRIETSGKQFGEDYLYYVIDNRKPEEQIPNGSVNLSISTEYSKSSSGRDLFYEVSKNVLSVKLKKLYTITEKASSFSQELLSVLDGVWNEEYTYSVTIKEYDAHDTWLATQTFSVLHNEDHSFEVNLNKNTGIVKADVTISYNPIS